MRKDLTFVERLEAVPEARAIEPPIEGKLPMLRAQYSGRFMTAAYPSSISGMLHGRGSSCMD
jgi:hypothetical protein